MRIGNLRIAQDAPPLVIAEIGVNHDGSMDQARALVDAACDAGADAVKVQWFEAKSLLSRAAILAKYQADAHESDPLAMLRRLELSAEELAALCDYIRARGALAIATVFSPGHVAPAAACAWDAFKVASPDLVNRPLLDELLKTGRALLVSTGASEAEEVRRTHEHLRTVGAEAVFLHCVSAYPTAMESAALGAIGHVSALTGGVAGYSDHTEFVETGALAVACGARALEKHITLDRSLSGPDHAASLEPGAFAEYALRAREAFEDGWAAPADHPAIGSALGDGVKRVLEIERDVRNVSRQSLVALRDIEAGEVIRRADLTTKRPGTGVSAWRIDEVVGAAAAERIEADWPITEEQIRWREVASASRY